MTRPGLANGLLPNLPRTEKTGSVSGCQFSKLRRTLRLGTQVVRTSADLVHFQPAPSEPESSSGGVDLMGAKVPAQASIKNAIISKGRFIAVLLTRWCRLAA